MSVCDDPTAPEDFREGDPLVPYLAKTRAEMCGRFILGFVPSLEENNTFDNERRNAGGDGIAAFVCVCCMKADSCLFHTFPEGPKTTTDDLRGMQRDKSRNSLHQQRMIEFMVSRAQGMSSEEEEEELHKL